MATTIEIQDAKLIEEAIKIGNHPSASAAVEAALSEYVRVRAESWENWIGTVPYYDDVDIATLRGKKGRK